MSNFATLNKQKNFQHVDGTYESVQNPSRYFQSWCVPMSELSQITINSDPNDRETNNSRQKEKT